MVTPTDEQTLGMYKIERHSFLHLTRLVKSIEENKPRKMVIGKLSE